MKPYTDIYMEVDMEYIPENLDWKRNPNNIVEIVSKNGPIARIDLNHEIWGFAAKHQSDEIYMKTIELLGDTKKLEGIGKISQLGGVVIPYFECRETTGGEKISYLLDTSSPYSLEFREKERENDKRIINPLFHSYEHMQGLSFTEFSGYKVTDKKSGITTTYDKNGNILPEKKIEHKADKEDKNTNFFSLIAKKISGLRR